MHVSLKVNVVSKSIQLWKQTSNKNKKPYEFQRFFNVNSKLSADTKCNEGSCHHVEHGVLYNPTHYMKSPCLCVKNFVWICHCTIVLPQLYIWVTIPLQRGLIEKHYWTSPYLLLLPWYTLHDGSRWTISTRKNNAVIGKSPLLSIVTAAPPQKKVLTFW